MTEMVISTVLLVCGAISLKVLLATLRQPVVLMNNPHYSRQALKIAKSYKLAMSFVFTFLFLSFSIYLFWIGFNQTALNF